jgi:hypothetical protein
MRLASRVLRGSSVVGNPAESQLLARKLLPVNRMQPFRQPSYLGQHPGCVATIRRAAEMADAVQPTFSHS